MSEDEKNLEEFIEDDDYSESEELHQDLRSLVDPILEQLYHDYSTDHGCDDNERFVCGNIASTLLHMSLKWAARAHGDDRGIKTVSLMLGELAEHLGMFNPDTGKIEDLDHNEDDGDLQQ